MMQTSSSGIKSAAAKQAAPAKLGAASTVFADVISRCKTPLILYFIAAFLFGPVSLIFGSHTSYYEGVEYLRLESPLIILSHLTVIGASIVIPMVVFSYLDNKRALDVFHALPVSREKMFLGNFMGGLAMTYAPYLLTTLPVSILADLFDYRYSLARNGAAATLEMEQTLITLYISVIVFSCFAMMSLMVISCSTLLESAGYFVLLEGGYFGLVYLALNAISNHAFGYYEFPIQNFLIRFSPLGMLEVLNGSLAEDWPALLQLTLFSLVIVYLAVRRLRARKSEQVTGGYIWPPLYYIASIGGSIAAGLVFTYLFGYSSVTGIIISVLFGLMLYVILDSIRHRGLKNILKSLTVGGCAAAGVGVFALIVGLTGTFGYEQWLPAKNEIASVQVQVGGDVSSLSIQDEFILDDPANIDRIYETHAAILANQKVLEEMNWYDSVLTDYTPFAFDDGDSAFAYGTTSMRVCYNMKDGRKVWRRYNTIPVALASRIAEVAGSTDYSAAMADMLEAYADQLLTMDDETFKAFGNYYEVMETDVHGLSQYSEVMNLDRRLAEEMIRAFANDLRFRPEGWKVSPDSQPVGMIRIEGQTIDGLSDGVVYGRNYFSYNFNIYPIDIETIAFLTDHGYYDPLTGILPKRNYEITHNVTEALLIPAEWHEELKAMNNGDVNLFSDVYCDLYHHTTREIDSYEKTEVTATDEPVPTIAYQTVSKEIIEKYGYDPDSRFFLGASFMENGIEVTDRVRYIELTNEQTDELRSLIWTVGMSDQPMDALYLNGRTYLIPKENLKKVEAILNSGITFSE